MIIRFCYGYTDTPKIKYNENEEWGEVTGKYIVTTKIVFSSQRILADNMELIKHSDLNLVYKNYVYKVTDEEFALILLMIDLK